MNSSLLPLATLSLLVASGCSSTLLTGPRDADAERAPAAEAAAQAAKAEEASKAAAALAETARKPGNFVVFKFSGAFRKQPLLLTERVIAREGDAIVVDVTADDGGKKRELRVRMSDAPEHRNQVLSVARLENGQEKPATLDAYESLFTGLSADSNDAVLGSEAVNVAVGKNTVEAKRTSFRVRVGKRHGTLSTLESPAFAWGNLGGEITADGGKVLFRAEVIDAGHTEPTAPTATPAAAVAYDE